MSSAFAAFTLPDARVNADILRPPQRVRHMSLTAFVLFLAIVFVGSYVQSVTGFAMGMIIVALVGGLRLLDIPTLAATVSLLTIINVLIALRGHWHEIHRHLITWIALGQVPAIFVGFMLLQYLDAQWKPVLELILGAFITAGGLSMLIKPHPWPQVTGRLGTWATGVMGGIVGGLFSASGPVLGWFGYNQPLPVAAIRATLLACFVLTTSTRTVFVVGHGDMTQEILLMAGAGLPVVLIGTLLGRYYPPSTDPEGLKRLAYGLLLTSGLWVLGRAAWTLGG